MNVFTRPGRAWLGSLLLALLPALASGQNNMTMDYGENAEARRADPGQARVEFDLGSVGWKMTGLIPGRGLAEGFDKVPAGHVGSVFLWTPAKVPGDVYTDLWKSGQLEDPYFGRNLEKARWVMDKEWWYTTQFRLPAEMKGRRLRLEFEGVDYACEVWVNGRRLGAHEGMLSGFGFDLTGLIDFGHENRLMVRLAPPPLNLSIFQGRKFFWGGDYWRFISPLGIWRGVKVVSTGGVRVEDVHAAARPAEGGRATVEIAIELDNLTGRAQDATVEARVQGNNFTSAPQGATVTAALRPGSNRVALRVALEDAQLWWPWDQGKPNLYQAEVLVRDATGVTDRRTVTFGIRTVTMERNPGFTDDEVQYPWTVRINGRRHYLRSVAWGGPPSILYGRTTVEHYRHLVAEARAGNVNNIRIFGWHPPEIREFYDLCDEAGITVWQGFSFGNAVLPKDDAFIQGALRETAAIVRERRNHPCLVLWQGGEEVIHTPEHLTGSNLQLMFAIGDQLRTLTDVPFVPLTSMSHATGLAAGFKPKENIHAGGRFYGLLGQSIEEYYPKLDYAIIPELMMTSAPNVESIRRFIPANELWPAGPSWGYHWADLDVLQLNNLEVFGDTRMGSLEEFVEATQIAQGTEFQFALEHFRRQKPRVSGTGVCHLMTWWPDFKWGLIDYYGERKRSFAMVARAYQPLLVSLEYAKRRWQPGEAMTGRLWVVNDHYDAHAAAVLRATVRDRAGAVLGESKWTVDVAPDSARATVDFNWRVPAGLAGGYRVELRLEDAAGRELSRNEYAFLVGDEAAARAERLKLREQLMKVRQQYSGEGYYRFFPELLETGRTRNH